MIVSIPDAAQRMNVSVDSVRRRVRSGTLPATRDQRGQWWLDLSDNDPTPGKQVDGDRMSLGVATPIQRDERENLINALEDQVDDLRVRLDRCERERREETENARTDRDRLLAMIERLSAGKENR